MTILTYPPAAAKVDAPAASPAPALALVLVDLGDNVAELRGSTLYLDAMSPAEDQLWAIADAADYLRTGQAAAGRRRRHLRAVTA